MRAIIVAVMTVAGATAASAQSINALLPGWGSAVGVSSRDLEPAEAERLKVQGGAYVDEIRPDMPGAQAGLQKSDIVVEFDGERVRSARHFSRLVQETPPGRQVRMSVLRDGSRRELTITPAAQSLDSWIDPRTRERLRGAMERVAEIPFEFDFDLPQVVVGQRSRLGATVQNMGPQLATYFGVKEGVLVSSVVEDSPAARAGLRAGDVITSINGRTIGSPGDLARELRSQSPGPADAEVKIGIVRDRKASEVSATIERPAWPVRPIRQVRRARPV
jgi:serine protease Do